MSNKLAEQRVCEFCGCRTNAHQRFCCAKGRDADKGSERVSYRRLTELLELVFNNWLTDADPDEFPTLQDAVFNALRCSRIPENNP